MQRTPAVLTTAFHKMLAPFGSACCTPGRRWPESAPPFHYGGDMIAEGVSSTTTSSTPNA